MAEEGKCPRPSLSEALIPEPEFRCSLEAFAPGDQADPFSALDSSVLMCTLTSRPRAETEGSHDDSVYLSKTPQTVQPGLKICKWPGKIQ